MISHNLICHDQSLADSQRHSFPCHSCDGRASGGWYAALPSRVGVMGGLRCSIARQRSGGVFASAGFHMCRALSGCSAGFTVAFPVGCSVETITRCGLQQLFRCVQVQAMGLAASMTLACMLLYFFVCSMTLHDACIRHLSPSLAAVLSGSPMRTVLLLSSPILCDEPSPIQHMPRPVRNRFATTSH